MTGLTLITRPIEDAHITAAALAAHNIAYLIEPMLHIRCNAEADLNHLDQYTHILCTSGNAIRCLARCDNRYKSIPLWVIGERSKAIAQENQFINVTKAGKDVESFINYINSYKYQKPPHFLYTSGDYISRNISSSIKLKEYLYTGKTVYYSSNISHFSEKCKRAFQEKSIMNVLFFSQRTTSVFNNLIKKNKLEKYLESLSAYCLSQTIAEEASELNWKAIYTANEPTQKDLLSLLV